MSEPVPLPVSRSPYHIYHRSLSEGYQKIIVYPQGSNLRDVRVFVNWNTGTVTVNGNIDSAIPHFPMEISLPAGFYDQSALGFRVFGSEQIVINFPFVGDGSWVPLRRLDQSSLEEQSSQEQSSHTQS